MSQRYFMPECVGLWGRLFGHKYIKKIGDHVFRTEYCYRCGCKQGGYLVTSAEGSDTEEE